MYDSMLMRAIRSVIPTMLFSVGASVLLAAFGMPLIGVQPNWQHFALAVVFPAVIAPLVGLPRAFAISRLKQAQRELERLARTDSLSGLMNRRAFFERADEIFALPPTRPIALLMIDVDDFKAINDNHGHEFGDGVIRAVATTIMDTVVGAVPPLSGISAPVIARFGGEEFVVLIGGLDEMALLRLADEVRGAVEKFVRLEVAMSMVATVSVGATLREPGQDIDAVLRTADAALYEAKRAGRNCVRLAAWAGSDATLAPGLPGASTRTRKRALDAA